MAFVSHKPVRLPGNFKKLFFAEADEHREVLDKIFWQIVGASIDEPLNGRLGDLAAPTLIIWGRHDRLIDVSCAAVLDEEIRDSELVIFEETGHVPMNLWSQARVRQSPRGSWGRGNQKHEASELIIDVCPEMTNAISPIVKGGYVMTQFLCRLLTIESRLI
jgi:hypothetical protein